MLSVQYGADVPPAMIELLEHHARRAGLSLGALEIIGASLDFVESFIVASEQDRAQDYLAQLGLAPPSSDRVSVARWQAEKVFG